jgi:hypothetical protein
VIHKLMDQCADNYERQRCVAADYHELADKPLRTLMQRQPQLTAALTAALNAITSAVAADITDSAATSPEAVIESQDVTAAVAEMPLPATAAVAELPTYDAVHLVAEYERDGKPWVDAQCECGESTSMRASDWQAKDSYAKCRKCALCRVKKIKPSLQRAELRPFPMGKR